MAMAAPYAASSVSFHARPAVFRPRASAGGPMPARGVSGKVEGAGGKWWAPLLGWSGRADYLAPLPARDDDAAPGRRASVERLLTEEKARELRARMVETECFHDAMYHSAIASRLARPS